MPKQDRDGLYRRPDSPYWWASYTDGEGKRRRKSTGCMDKRAATRWLAAAQLGQPAEPEAGEIMSFGDLTAMYLADLSQRSRAREMPSSWVPVARLLGEMPLPLTPADVRQYVRLRRQQGVSNTTINNELSKASTAIRWGNRELELQHPNPIPGRKPKPGPPRDFFFTREEVDRIIRYLEDGSRADYLPDAVRLAAHSGMRLNETLRLTWRQIDRQRMRIWFGPEQQKAERNDWIPLNSAVAAVLDSRPRYIGSDVVLVRRDGSRPNWRVVTRNFTAARIACGIAQGTFHSLRHTFGSWLLNEGVPIADISRLLRHATIDITLRIYGHHTDERLAESSEVVTKTGVNVTNAS